jgi:glycosyltransferase involved in cell wall biosynthesis
MKIALIEPVGGHGGMDYYDYGLAQGLGNNNIDVYYFSTSKTKERNYKNVTTLLYFSNVWENKNKIVRLFYLLMGYYKSFKKAKQLKIRIVHLQFFDLGIVNFLVLILSLFFDFTKILTLHDISSFKKDKVRFIENWILNRFKYIIVHNKLSEKELILKGYKKNRIRIIPHGNYLPFVEKLDYKKNSDDVLQLLFFGQIKKVKGLDILLKALAIVSKQTSNIHLTIAGRPWHDDKKKYEDLIKKLNIQRFVTINFNFIPDEDVALYFEKSDVVILPYKRIYQSGVLLLTMSYGRVCLTSNLPAFLEIIEHKKTGYVFESENQYSLSNVILDILKDKSKLKEINSNASSILESKFDWNNIGFLTKKLYEESIK